jgi:hypothetical protein
MYTELTNLAIITHIGLACIGFWMMSKFTKQGYINLLLQRARPTTLSERLKKLIFIISMTLIVIANNLILFPINAIAQGIIVYIADFLMQPSSDESHD